VNTFYLTILFSAVYIGFYWFGPGRSIQQDFEDSKQKLEMAHLMSHAGAAHGPSEQELLAVAASEPALRLGKTIFQGKCASCHGAEGHGDGPNGPLTKAPDLTRQEWQAKVSDADIAARILQGKGLMPKFELPAPVVTALVGRIRASRGR
jgi:mono/diheme cytochrome c family protein